MRQLAYMTQSANEVPIDKPSIRVFFDDEDLRVEFKQLVAVDRSSMSRRLMRFVAMDVAYWKKTGKPVELEDLFDALELASDDDADDSEE